MEDSEGFFCSGDGCWLSLEETEDNEGFLRSCSVEGLWRRPWLTAGLSTGRREVGRGIPELGLGIPEGCSMLTRSLSLARARALSLSLSAAAVSVAGRAWCRRVAHRAGGSMSNQRIRSGGRLARNCKIISRFGHGAAATAGRVHTRV